MVKPIYVNFRLFAVKLVGVRKFRNISLSVQLPYMSLVVRKPVFGFFDLVPHKPGCTAIEDR